MVDDRASDLSASEAALVRRVAVTARRKLATQRRGIRSVWAGLGVSGVIGWSVVVPTLAGAMLGLWLDRRHAGVHSWTLALLVAGLVIGCANAWHWIVRQDDAMHEPPGDPDE